MITNKKNIERLAQLVSEVDADTTPVDAMMQLLWTEISQTQYQAYWMLCFNVNAQEGIVSYNPAFRFGYAKVQLERIGITPFTILLIDGTYLNTLVNTASKLKARESVLDLLKDQQYITNDYHEQLVNTLHENGKETST